jgi:hypothetical protein
MSEEEKREYELAHKLFREFNSRDARDDEIVRIGGLARPVIALEVGKFVGIGYRATGNGEKFFHEFESPLPRVFVRFDGRQVHILGGAYRFTAKGFEG